MKLSEHPEAMSEFLHTRKMLPFSGVKLDPQAVYEAVEFGLAAAVYNPAAATIAATCLAVAAELPAAEQRPEVTNEVLERLRDLHTPRTLWCLEMLVLWPGLGTAREKAREQAALLRSAGVQPRPPVMPGEFSHAKISSVNSSGQRHLLLFRRTPEGGLDGLALDYSDRLGLLAMANQFGTASQMEYMLTNLHPDLAWANIQLPLARDFLADLLACHEAVGTAPSGELFAMLPFWDGTVNPTKRHQPNLGAYMLETVRRTPELLLNSDRLFKMPIIRTLVPIPDTAEAFCRKRQTSRAGRVCKKDLPNYLESVLLPERENLLNHLAANLELEALAGRATDRNNQAAARLWLALKEEVVPFTEIPLIVKLGEASLERALEKLKNAKRKRGGGVKGMETNVMASILAAVQNKLETSEAGNYSTQEKSEILLDVMRALHSQDVDGSESTDGHKMKNPGT